MKIYKIRNTNTGKFVLDDIKSYYDKKFETLHDAFDYLSYLKQLINGNEADIIDFEVVEFDLIETFRY